MRSITLFRTVATIHVIVTIAAMALAYRTLRRADDSERRVIRSHQILRAMEETIRQLVGAESWERAYVATKTAEDLAAFNQARSRVQTLANSLASILTAEGHEQDASLLRTQIAVALAAFQDMVARVGAGLSVDGTPRLAARASVEAARTTADRITQIENAKLDARVQESAAAGLWVNGLAFLMTGIATALVTMLVTLAVFVARPGVWHGR